jgi:hypothetical protein
VSQIDDAPLAATPRMPPRVPLAGRSSRRSLLASATVAWTVVAVLVQMLRSNRTPIWDGVWAEDGRYFYGAARAHGLFGTLFEPLAGYLQVPARFLSWVATLFPTSDAAAAISLLAATSAALCSVYVFLATDRVVPRLWQRFFLAVLVVLHPAAAFEVVAGINNVHWYLMFAAFWAILSRAESGRRIALDVVVVVLAGLSDPQTGLLLPLVLLRAWRGHRSARFTSVGLVVALVLQYVLAVARFGAGSSGSKALDSLPVAYGYRVAGSFLLGDSAIGGWWDAHGSLPAIIALVVIGVGFALALQVNKPRERRLLAALLGYSVVFFVAPFLVRGGIRGILHHPATLNGSRYTIIPLWMLYAALVVAVGRPLPRPASHALARIVPPALVVVMGGSQLIANYTISGPRTAGTSWREGVREAAQVCAARGGVRPPPSRLPSIARPKLLSADTVSIPVVPWGPAWAVHLRCDQL